MATQQRAKIGGEAGVNGEWYEGGKFLPSTEKPKGKPSKRGLGKQEIEPYKWEVLPEGKRSIYRQLAGVYARLINGVMVANINPVTLKYYGKTESEVIDMINRYNAGERAM